MSKYAVHQTQSQTSGNTKPLRECGERVGHSSNQNCGEGLRDAVTSVTSSRPEGGERKRKEALWLFGGRVIPAEDLANAKALGQRAWPARMRLAGSESARGRGGGELVRGQGVCGRGKRPVLQGFLRVFVSLPLTGSALRFNRTLLAAALRQTHQGKETRGYCNHRGARKLGRQEGGYDYESPL